MSSTSPIQQRQIRARIEVGIVWTIRLLEPCKLPADIMNEIRNRHERLRDVPYIREVERRVDPVEEYTSGVSMQDVLWEPLQARIAKVVPVEVSTQTYQQVFHLGMQYCETYRKRGT